MGLVKSLAVTGLFLLSGLVSASPNFTYVNFGYVRDNIVINDQKCTQDGWSLAVSLPLNEWFYAVGAHTDQTSNDWCGATRTQLGAGIHNNVGLKSVIFGELSAIIANYPWDENIGGGVTLGLRRELVHGTEGKGFLTYESIDGYEVTLLGLGVNMWMNQRLSGYLDLAFGSGSEQRLQLGIRYNF